MCVVGACTRVCVHTWRPGEESGRLTLAPSTLSAQDRLCLRTRNLLAQLGWLASEISVSARLCPPVMGLQAHAVMPGYLHGFQGCKSTFSFVHCVSAVFHRAVSPAPVSPLSYLILSMGLLFLSFSLAKDLSILFSLSKNQVFLCFIDSLCCIILSISISLISALIFILSFCLLIWVLACYQVPKVHH